MTKSILNKSQIDIKLKRLSFEVAESAKNNELIIIGVKENGLIIAKALIKLLEKITDLNLVLISASLNKTEPKNIVFDKEINFNNKDILIVDDVCNTGKTLLYILKPILDFFPNKIEMLVLADRLYKQFPVTPNYVGLSIATTLTDYVEVELLSGEINEVKVLNK